MNHLNCTVSLLTGGNFLIPLNSFNNLQLFYPLLHHSSSSDSSFLHLFDIHFLDASTLTPFVADILNQNLTSSQKELLIWYWRSTHAGFAWIQSLMKHHIFPALKGGIDIKENPVIPSKIRCNHKILYPKMR